NNHWSSMDAFTGNRGTGNEPDYVFIDATPGKQYTASNYTNNRNGQTNTYENVNIQNVVKGPNHIEAVLDGEGGYWLPPAGNGTTSIEIVSEIGFQEYEVEVIARLQDTDGSEELIPEIKLSGLPEGAVVMLDGVKLSSQDGVFVIANPEISEDGMSSKATVTVRVPGGSGSLNPTAEASSREKSGGDVGTGSNALGEGNNEGNPENMASGISAFGLDPDNDGEELSLSENDAGLGMGISAFSIRMAPTDTFEEEGRQTGEGAYASLLDSEDDDWADGEHEVSTDVQNGANKLVESDDALAAGPSVPETTQDSEPILEQDLNLGEVLDELAAEDDLDDILDSALNDHESKVPDEGTMVGREDQSENQDDASVNSNADTVISRKADGPAGSGRLVG